MIVEMAGRAAQVLVALAGAYLVVLWFALIVWTFRDIEARSRSVFTQVFSTLLSVLFFVPGVLLYLLLRPKVTLDEAFQRSLEEEYLLQDLEELPHCSSCHRYVEDDFVLCPHCHAQLREPCAGCERLIDLRWPLCPYCGTVQSELDEAADRVEAPAARWTAPALRRRRPAASESKPRALPAPADEDPAEVAMVLPRPRAGVADSLDTQDDDASSLAASLASGMRSMARPFDRLLGRGSLDRTDERSLEPFPTGNGHQPGDNGTHQDRTVADSGLDEQRNQHAGMTLAEPVVPRHRFAGNGQQGPGFNGRGERVNGSGAETTDALVDFPSETERRERQPEPAAVSWPPRDRDG